MPIPNKYKELCANCNCTYGSHLANTLYKDDKVKYPKDCCPGHEGRMDWEDGPKTTFKESGKFKEETKDGKA
jgi:hypothetical protein